MHDKDRGMAGLTSVSDTGRKWDRPERSAGPFGPSHGKVMINEKVESARPENISKRVPPIYIQINWINAYNAVKSDRRRPRAEKKN